MHVETLPPFPAGLQRKIEQAILGGTLPAGRVITINELRDIFNAEPQACEQVMQAQVRKGLAKQQGNDYQVLGIQGKSLDSLFQHTARAGMKPASQVRAAIIEPASEIVASKLELPLDAPVYRLERTRIVNNEVLANQVNYIPYEVSPGLEHDDISLYSFQKLLEERYHTVITGIQEDIRLVLANPEDLKVLSLPGGSQVLVVERLSFSCNQIPVVWASIHIRADRYHYVAALWPKAAQLLPDTAEKIPNPNPKESSMSIENTCIYPINTGWAKADLGTYMFFKGPGGEKIEIPVLCYLVDTGEHKIMVDTGMPDAERATKYHHESRKADCLDSPDAVIKLGVDPDDVDICIFTHMHWDHMHCMKRFKNARYITTAEEIRWAYNPLPLWYRSYESPILGIEAPFVGCHFELVEGEATIVPGVTVFPTPGHTPGHQSVAVETRAGTIVLVGDAIFLYRNFEPREDEHWRYWVQQRFVNMIDGWKSMEEIDRRADFILPCHDVKVLEHPVYPYDGMPLRKRREPVPGAPFYFTGL